MNMQSNKIEKEAKMDQESQGSSPLMALNISSVT